MVSMESKYSVPDGRGQQLYAGLVRYLQERHSLGMNVFWMALDCYREAVRCYDNEIFEAATIMCRNTIDSAIFEAALKRCEQWPANAASWEYKTVFNSQYDWYTEWLKAGEETRGILEEYAIDKLRRIAWGRLKQLAVYKLKIIKKAEVKNVENIRELGNYSAHRAQGITKDMIKSLGKQSTLKIRTSEDEAQNALVETKKILEMICDRYFEREERRLHK